MLSRNVPASIKASRPTPKGTPIIPGIKNWANRLRFAAIAVRTSHSPCKPAKTDIKATIATACNGSKTTK